MEVKEKGIIQIITDIFKHRKVICIIGVLVISFIATMALRYYSRSLTLEIEIKMSRKDVVQVFFKTAGEHYSEKNSRSISFDAPGMYKVLKFRLPSRKVNFIRIDLGTKAGEILIKNIGIKIGDKHTILDVNKIIDSMESANNIKEFKKLRDEIKIQTIGNDPYFEISVNIDDITNANVFNDKAFLILFTIFILLSPFIYVLIFSITKLIVNKSNYLIEIDSAFTDNENAKLISFNRNVYSILVVFLLMFAVFTSFKVHYSSIGIWDDIIPDANHTSVVFGKPRGIRSDEWLVATPFILSQYNNNFPDENISIGASKSPLISSYNLPVMHFTSFFRIQHWGFYFLGKEIGFSYYWNFKLIGLLVVLFLFFLIITKTNIYLSLVGAFWITFSNFTQWWFSICLPEQLIFSVSMIISFLYILVSENRTIIIINAIVLLFSMVNFLMLFYLPWQIALTYFIIFAIVGIVFSNYKYYKKHFQVQKKFKILSLFFVFLGFFSVAGILIYELRDSIEILLNTVYPGLRSSTGGTVSVYSHLSGFFEFFNNEVRFPSIFGNICESSRFILFYPLILGLCIYQLIKKRKINFIILSMGFLVMLIAIWQIIGMNQLLSKILLLDRLPENRAFLPVGLASIIMVITHFSEKNIMLVKYEKIIIIISLLLAISLFSHKWNQYMNNYLTTLKLTIIIILISLCFISIIVHNKYLFTIILFIILTPNLYVNPVCEGLSSICERKILLRAKEIHENNSNCKWAVFGSFFYPQIFKAAGIPVINGVNYLPDLPRMQVLSNGRDYSNIYNRYAHVQLDASESDDVLFELHQGDLYSITIRPDSHLLKKIGVKYVVLPVDIKSDCFKFKRKLTDIPLNGFNIYELY